MEPREEQPYRLDDLVRDEKRHTWFLVLLLVAAVVYVALSGRGPGGADGGGTGPVTDPAPVDTAGR